MGRFISLSLLADDFGGGGALASDVDAGGGGLGHADALEIVVFNRGVGVDFDVSATLGADSYGGDVAD